MPPPIKFISEEQARQNERDKNLKDLVYFAKIIAWQMWLVIAFLIVISIKVT